MLRRFFPFRHKKFLPVRLEHMEPRQLLSGDIVGTPGDDQIVVAYGDNAYDVIIISAPGFADGTILHNVHNLVIDGADGNDYIEIQQGGYPAANRGGGNWATLRGGNGDDILLGGDNGTTFDGGPGNDQITGRQPDGWQWMDDLIFPNAPHGVIVRLDLGEVLEDGFGGHDTATGTGDIQGTPWDDVIYAGPRNGWIYGKGGNDLLSVGPRYANLVGDEGDDTLLGGNEGDVLVPGSGNDLVMGGGGRDWLQYYEYMGMTHGAVIRLDQGLVDDDGSGGIDHLASIEDATVYNNFGDTIVGDGTDNVLHGNDGADFIAGGGGNDSLQGGNCATLLGGTGDDYLPSDYRFTVLDGGHGADKIELWGYSDSIDHIVPDSDDTLLDHRGPQPTPPDHNIPPCEVLPYETPTEPMPAGAGSVAPIVAPQPKHKKPKRHHRRDNLSKINKADLPIAARIMSRSS
jgi:Ca2+-binding RTX toxin-like protein